MVSPHEVVTGQRMRTTRDLLGFSDLPASQAELIRDMFYSVSRDNARTAIAHDHAEKHPSPSACQILDILVVRVGQTRGCHRYKKYAARSAGAGTKSWPRFLSNTRLSLPSLVDKR